MASGTHLHFFLIPIFALFSVVLGGDFCTSGRSGWPHALSYDTTYCVYGCCGYYPNQYCCSYSVGVIVGGVFGAIAGLALLVALVCCCCVRGGTRGQTVRTLNPQPWGNVAVVSTSNMNYTYSPGLPPAQPQAPPPYSAPPPAYTAVYPPQAAAGVDNAPQAYPQPLHQGYPQPQQPYTNVAYNPK